MQSIEQLIVKVPAPVRSFILDELPSASESLMNRYRLHVDQGGVLETELLLMLLGQSTPKEFVDALAKSGVPEETVRQITDDVNKEVFMRLRRAEQEGEALPSSPTGKSELMNRPQPSVPAERPARTPVQDIGGVRKPALAVEVTQPAPKQVAPPPNLPGQAPAPPPCLRRVYGRPDRLTHLRGARQR